MAGRQVVARREVAGRTQWNWTALMASFLCIVGLFNALVGGFTHNWWNVAVGGIFVLASTTWAIFAVGDSQ